MNKTVRHISVTLLILILCFLLGLIVQNIFKESTLIPALFVLGVFLIAVTTEGYIYGIISSLISVLAVNFAFAFPYFRFNFTIPENIFSAILLLVVTVITCSLTNRVRRQEIIKAESEKERMRANLLRAVSHDLRTPLTTIYSTSSALTENYDNFSHEQIKNMLKGISEDSQWLYRMVENLLSITKLDGTNVKIMKTETALDELIDSVLVKFAKRYPEIKVSVDIPDDLLFIPMDALLIEQVALNILENAVQHAKGMTKLSLRVYIKEDKAIFEIEDNGCGIPPDKINDIFTGNYSETTKLYDGKKTNAGIGLSVCASIIKAHGGEINAENKNRGGCIFRFALAIEENENE